MESGILGFGIRGFGIRNTAIGIQNPSTTDKDWNQVPGFWNLRHRIQNPRLSWNPLQGTRSVCVLDVEIIL